MILQGDESATGAMLVSAPVSTPRIGDIYPGSHKTGSSMSSIDSRYPEGLSRWYSVNSSQKIILVIAARVQTRIGAVRQ